MIEMGIRRRTWNYYKGVVDECSNPECESYSELEVHHIVPPSVGGEDTFDNIIVLCEDCHRFNRNRFHSDWILHHDTLHKWKYNIDSKRRFSKQSGFVAIPPVITGLASLNKPESNYVGKQPIKDTFVKNMEPCDRLRIIPAKGITTIQDFANAIQITPSKLLDAFEQCGIRHLDLGREYAQKLVRLEDLQKTECVLTSGV